MAPLPTVSSGLLSVMLMAPEEEQALSQSPAPPRPSQPSALSPWQFSEAQGHHPPPELLHEVLPRRAVPLGGPPDWKRAGSREVACCKGSGMNSISVPKTSWLGF